MPAGASLPATVRWAVVLLGLQTLGWVGLVALVIYADVRSPATSTAGAVGSTIFVVLIAGLFGLFTWALAGLRRWARSPAIVLELLQLPIGYSLVSSGGSLVGIPVMLLAAVTIVLLLAPTTRAAFGAQ